MMQKMKARWKQAQSHEQAFWVKEKKDRRLLSYLQQKKRWEEFLKDYGLKLEMNGTILEIGPGGHGLIDFTNGSQTRIALDPLRPFFKKLLAGVLSPEPHSIKGVGEAIPVKDMSMDIVICINVFDHMMDYRVVMKEINRVLKGKGLLIFHVKTTSLIETLVRKMARHAMALIYKTYDPSHPHDIFCKPLIEDFKKNHFEVTKIHLAYRPYASHSHVQLLPFLVLRFLENLLFKCISRELFCNEVKLLLQKSRALP